MPPSDDTRKLSAWLATCTFLWLAGYVPLETYVTISIAGLPGLLYASYIMNVLGMGLMLWGALSAKNGKPYAPGVLTAGWAWTAATFWRATSDRFWWVSKGEKLFAGTTELWLAVLLTALAVLGMVACLVLVLRSHPSTD